MSNSIESYQKLAFKEALSRNHRYSVACKDLSLILREAYHKLPENLQSVVFQDTLAAFRLLPEQTRSAVSAAHLLCKSAEAVLPKQRKILVLLNLNIQRLPIRASAATELPQDVLVHIFSFLDIHSLVADSLVSWQFIKEIRASNRGYYVQCETIVWLDNMKCCNGDCELQSGNWQIMPVSTHQLSYANSYFLQVVEYLLYGSSSILSASDSDSESDEGSIPRYIGRYQEKKKKKKKNLPIFDVLKLMKVSCIILINFYWFFSTVLNPITFRRGIGCCTTVLKRSTKNLKIVMVEAFLSTYSSLPT
ncbi:hypothetical protein P3X46_023846 [Hevea brasiliensis]|uniref:F-box domain-containing protein n=1 Tax=Hevea brasiliensis TaxID=3981 RepID=A0ABQ9LE49_HEVBR|nr:hypothetical protein P3X46_023846 [Hevea brasiliensis]